jgi:hypothetical protein
MRLIFDNYIFKVHYFQNEKKNLIKAVLNRTKLIQFFCFLLSVTPE